MELQSDVPTTRETQRAYKEASIKAGETSHQNMMHLKCSVDTVTGIKHQKDAEKIIHIK